MLIFYGLRTRTVGGSEVSNITCESCRGTKHVAFGYLQYAHIFWIPFILLSRKMGIECQDCKKTLVGNEIDARVASQIKDVVFSTKDTIFSFIGLFLLLFFVSGFLFLGEQKKKQEIAFIASPVVHDLYLVDYSRVYPDNDSTYRYGVMRVFSVNGSAVEFELSKIAYDKKKGATEDVRNKKAMEKDYYSEEFETFEVSALQEMRKNDVIYAVERP